jgi:broad specificity phosphatase PhoE
LMASPKRRARETLHPVAASLSIPLVVSNSLDERRQDETGMMFSARIRAWVESLNKDLAPDEVIWACSHADWLESIMDIIPSDLDEWEKLLPFSPGQYRIFNIIDGVWKKAK